MLQGKRPTFADNGDILLIANGTRIIHTDGDENTQFIQDPDAPTKSTHIVFLDGYFIANNVGTGKFQRSVLFEPLNWKALAFATAEGNPDDLSAILVKKLHLYLLGTRSGEIWFNDGSTPFSPRRDTFIEEGIIAPNASIKVGEILLWPNHKREIVALEGFRTRVLSAPIAKILQGFTSFSDAHADNIEIDGYGYYVMHFPGERRTLVYDYKIDAWYDWSFWNAKDARRERWLGNCFLWATVFNQRIVGSRRDGIIYKLSFDFNDDDGKEFRFLKRSGNIDHGTSRKKRSKYLVFKLRRGFGKTDRANPLDKDAVPQMMVRWRDNGSNTYGKEKLVNLGRLGETESIIRVNTGGQYSTRQYEISSTDSAPLTIIELEEEFEFLIR